MTDTNYREAINGTTLHFRVRGQKPDAPRLLILHGGPGFSAHMFLPWGESIEDRFRVVYLDQRGCGESERLTTDAAKKSFTVKNLLADLEGVRSFLKAENWFVLGHSWGGMLGLEYAAAHPKSVRGYVHMNGLLSQPMTQDAIFAFARTQVAVDAGSSDPERVARGKRLAPFVDFGPKLPAGPQRLMSAMQFAMALPEAYYADQSKKRAYEKRVAVVFAQSKLSPSVAYAPEPALALLENDGYATRDARALLPKISVPTLVLHGKQDRLIPTEHAKLVGSGIRGARLELLDACGHFPFVEQPEHAAEAIRSFAK